jgi:hypothetical protein
MADERVNITGTMKAKALLQRKFFSALLRSPLEETLRAGVD